MAKTVLIHKALSLKDRYFIGENATAQDEEIPFELVGVVAFLSSLPDDWQINAANLVRKGTGQNKSYKLVNQLCELGFLRRETERNPNGTVKRVHYHFYAVRSENPEYAQLHENHNPDIHHSDIHDDDNHRLQNKESIKERKEPKETGKQNKTAAALIAHYIKATKSIIPNAQKLYNESANALVAAGVTVKDMYDFIAYLKGDTFWQTRNPSWDYVCKNILAWKTSAQDMQSAPERPDNSLVQGVKFDV